MKKLKYLWSNCGGYSSMRQRQNTRVFQKATNNFFFPVFFLMYVFDKYAHDDK